MLFLSPARGFKIVKNMGFIQYIKDTRGELRHVAWPTRLQTIVYTVLVILISIAVAVYLGIFDFLFTSGLRNVLEVLPERVTPGLVAPAEIATTTATTTNFFQ